MMYEEKEVDMGSKSQKGERKNTKIKRERGKKMVRKSRVGGEKPRERMKIK